MESNKLYQVGRHSNYRIYPDKKMADDYAALLGNMTDADSRDCISITVYTLFNNEYVPSKKIYPFSE